ncbi:MAG: M28 family peptidase, partial [Calditrichaeota bacterium]|nr:M28 family peptidase [Calditrichota bacterium]
MRQAMFIILVLLILQIDKTEIINHFKETVQVLSADKMMGRSSLRPEIWQAARYIHQEFEKIGLSKLDNGSFYQRFTRPEGQEIANVIGYHLASSKTNKSLIFVAHYDGLGIGKANAEGDSIYNGAVDNAVGVAALS